jgi:alkylation response protein AidB-like acyl-CoA dehydrogenase
MMTYVEVGAATARRAANPADMTTIEAQKIKLIARIFANDVAQLVSQNMLKILMGCNIFDADKISDFLDAVEFKELSKSSQGIIGDMDKLADLIFER